MAGLASVAAGGTMTLSSAELALATSDPESVKLNVLFIGAHPDDEAGTLGALGQWNEYSGMKAGVITTTRGEGGGNAVGLEEGPALGLLREAEERVAVGLAGITHVYNLDALDFYYTASAPLSRKVWGGDALLNRIVRVVRATRPEVIVTMNPSAVEGNHGNHQQAAMYAVEAYLRAGDPTAFPEHFAEGFSAWTPSRILQSGASGSGTTGPDGVAKGYVPRVTSDIVFGAWNGTPSQRHGKRWSAVRDEAMWAYVTQGWAERAPSSSDPAAIPSTWFTLIHTRGPLVAPTLGNDAALRGAALPISGGLPLGTHIEVSPERYEFVPGESAKVTVTVTAPRRASLGAGSVTLAVPSGWSTSARQSIAALRSGASQTVTFTVTAGAGATIGATANVRAVYSVGATSGETVAPVRVAGALEATIEPLPEIAQFRDWTAELKMKHLDALVPELFSVAQSRSRELRIKVHNYSQSAQAGQVSIAMPSGFSASPSTFDVATLASGQERFASITVANTDASIPTANRPANRGVWPVQITTQSTGAPAVRTVTLNLVPSHTSKRASSAPTINGVLSEGEYPGAPIPVDTIWDGSPAGGTTTSISGQAWLTHDASNLYVFLSVKDDIRGTILPIEDNKRQRRTDSVEIYVDPRGTAEHTAQTLIAGIMPSMGSMTGPAGVGRDRDAYQGEAHITAPGMEVAVTMADSEAAYTGYDLEVKIPFAVLPDNIDPARMGFNILINDSDTQNKAAQRRVGWSTFSGVRADPWRWGQVSLEGLADAGPAPKDPILPDIAARSVESPQSILQSAGDGVPLGGWSPTSRDLKIATVQRRRDALTAIINGPGSGLARVYVWDGESVLAHARQNLQRGSSKVTLNVAGLEALLKAGKKVQVLASFEAGTQVSAAAAVVK
ncbi:PIG-L family deacetylase [Tessaracoccus sp. SD287]|uniref:PIG-L family deacetylase n=1 Tax=Tessaracoccus sp. SD287 TaxID=2782008 RepID=UPI001A973B9F|nr:PIG-L family deacetylase [Tessaracoccus sp. SD287]